INTSYYPHISRPRHSADPHRASSRSAGTRIPFLDRDRFGKGRSVCCFRCFLQEIISGRRFLAAGTLSSEWRLDHKTAGYLFPDLNAKARLRSKLQLSQFVNMRNVADRYPPLAKAAEALDRRTLARADGPHGDGSGRGPKGR